MTNNDNFLRPCSLKEFIGQENIKKRLEIYLYSAKKRNTVLDHLLLYGPPGLGKTSLAYVIANEMDSKISIISAPSIKETCDLVSILSSLDPGDILFIDEIHRLDKEIEEILYNAMEDFCINITYKSEEGAKIIKLDLAPFTLIGATTLASNISRPLRDRFGIIFNFNYYTENELSLIIQKNSKKLGFDIDLEASNILALRCKKTPRIANNYLKRIYDYMIFMKISKMDRTHIYESLKIIGINKFGLTELDINILKVLHYNYGDQPVSLESIAAIINENTNNIRDLSETYLVNIGLIARTKRGRKITDKGIQFLFDISDAI